MGDRFSVPRFNVTWPTRWKCIWCGEGIPAKEPHVRFAGFWNEKKQNWGMHCECYDVFAAEDNDGRIDKWSRRRGSVEMREGAS